MKTLLPALLLMAGVLNAAAADSNKPGTEWVNQPFSSLFARFQSVTIVPHPEDKNIVAANCEHDKQWWGDLRIFKHDGDKIEWAAVFPQEYLKEKGHYVFSCRWITLEATKNRVLEVISSTHMGNGSLWLLELEDQKFRVLLHTSVRGQFWKKVPGFSLPPGGEGHFGGPHLKIDYQRQGGEAAETVVLTGCLSIQDMEEKKLPEMLFEQKCIWDAGKRTFVEGTPKLTKQVGPKEGGR